MVSGEELPIAPSITDNDVAVGLTPDPAVMVTAADELPEVPVLSIAVVVIWCCPGATGMACTMLGCELACCHTVAESTAICHC